MTTGPDTDWPSFLDLPQVIRSSFPAELEADVAVVVAHIPPPHQGSPSYATNTSPGVVLVGGQALSLVGRVYSPEPDPDSVRSLTDRQKLLLSCWYSRHHDGYVRERHLRNIVTSDEVWIPPFVLQPIGEYIPEICQVAFDAVGHIRPEIYKAFAADNPGFMRAIRAKVVSYYLYRFGHRARQDLAEYPGYRFLDSLGLWHGPEGKRWLRAKSSN